jgi:hypothetical protein
MATRNPITNDEIKSKPFSESGRKNWDLIFQKKTAAQWIKDLGYNPNCIIDDDGWRDSDGVDLNTPITRSDFFNRFNRSTVNLPIKPQ